MARVLPATIDICSQDSCALRSFGQTVVFITVRYQVLIVTDRRWNLASDIPGSQASRDAVSPPSIRRMALRIWMSLSRRAVRRGLAGCASFADGAADAYSFDLCSICANAATIVDSMQLIGVKVLRHVFRDSGPADLPGDRVVSRRGRACFGWHGQAGPTGRRRPCPRHAARARHDQSPAL